MNKEDIKVGDIVDYGSIIANVILIDNDKAVIKNSKSIFKVNMNELKKRWNKYI
mgnify:CR=1 FL=1